MSNLVWFAALLLVAVWAIGLSLHVAGGLIHVILFAAIAVVLFRIASGGGPLRSH